MTDCQSTHGHDCWDWGPKHYECAVGQIGRDEALLRQALEALEAAVETPIDQLLPTACDDAIAALRERLGEGAEP